MISHTPCDNCGSTGKNTLKCGGCQGRGQSIYSYPCACHACNGINSTPSEKILKTIGTKLKNVTNPRNHQKNAVYDDAPPSYDYFGLKLIKKTKCDPFADPTYFNLYYRLYLATDKFTKHKIFLNVRGEKNDANVPIWDKIIDGCFITKADGSVEVNYDGYFSRALTVLNKCYILVNPSLLT